jgi:UDP-glucose 4-epimerase
MNKYNHALVTGGAGFIGSNLVDALLKKGLKVTSVDNYLTGNAANLREARLSPNFAERNIDVRDITKDHLKLWGIDIIFHQAASKKVVCMNSPYKDLDINAGGTLNMMLSARDAGISKFIHASTGSIYGEVQRHSGENISDGVFTRIQNEEYPANPVSYYGISKLAGEQYVRLINKNATVLRYFHVYGPRQDYSERGGVVSIFASRMIKGLPPVIFGDGLQERSFTYVQDVVNANLFFMENELSGIFNVASGEKINLLTLVDHLNDILGTNYIPDFYYATPGDIKYFNVSNDKLKQAGFIFLATFKSGLRCTIDHLYGQFN